MFYKYIINNKIYKVWRNEFFSDTISVYDSDNNEKIFEVLNENDKEYIVFNNTKVYLDSWIKTSYEDFIKILNYKNGYYLFDTTLSQMIMSEGVDKIQFIIQENHNEDPIVYIIDEHTNSVKLNYKIDLRINSNDHKHQAPSFKSFYTSDLVKLIIDGIVKVQKVL